MSENAINNVGDQLESQVAAKFQTLMAPFRDGAKVPVVAPEAAPSAASQQPPQTAASPVVTPAPAAAQPAASTPADDIPEAERPPAGASKATQENWTRFRALKQAEIEKHRKEAETIKSQFEAAQAELTKFKAGPAAADPAELEALKQSKAELEAVVEKLRLEESPKFKNYYDGGIDKQLKLVKAVAGPHGDELVKLIQSPRSAERNARLRELQEELGPEGMVVGNALGEIARLQMERAEQLANWKENSKRLREVEESEKTTSQKQLEAQRQVRTESLLAKVKDLPEFKLSDPKDADHAAFIAQALDFIKSAGEGRLPEQDATVLPVAAMKAQYLEAIKIPRMEAELTTLRARVAEMTGAAPRVDGSQRSAGQVMSRDSNDPYGSNSVVAKFRSLWGGAAS